MVEIKEITYEKCLDLWRIMWADRVSPIEPVSAMTIQASGIEFSRFYTKNIGEPTFLGAFIGPELVGVNSLHSVDLQYRSRGLYVRPEYRGNKIGELLLKETIARSESLCWSFPRKEALNTYLRSGFVQITDLMYDEIEKKYNCYVASEKHLSQQQIALLKRFKK